MWLGCDFRFVQFSINLEIDLEQSAFFSPVKLFPRRGVDFIVFPNIIGFTFGGVAIFTPIYFIPNPCANPNPNDSISTFIQILVETFSIRMFLDSSRSIVVRKIVRD